MESNDEIRAQLRAIDRAAAAPYVDYPKNPWWAVPAFATVAPLFVLGVNLSERSDVPDALAALLMAIVVISAWGYAWWQYRRWGAAPADKAPREVNRVMWGFVAGAVVVGVALFMLADWAPLWLAMPTAFMLVAAGLFWFGRAYARAAQKVRERLE